MTILVRNDSKLLACVLSESRIVVENADERGFLSLHLPIPFEKNNINPLKARKNVENISPLFVKSAIWSENW